MYIGTAVIENMWNCYYCDLQQVGDELASYRLGSLMLSSSHVWAGVRADSHARS